MQKGRKRFTRDAIESSEVISKAVYLRYISPSNIGRLERTLDLRNIGEMKPTINGVMPTIEARLEEEERIREEEYFRQFQREGWTDRMVYDCMGEDDIPIELLNAKQLKKLNKKLFTGKNKESKSNKRGHRGKGKKFENTKYLTYDDLEDDEAYWNNRKTMYTHGEWDEEEDNVDSYKKINFYPDVTNELSVIKFNSLKEFSDYCDRNNYTVKPLDYSNLKNWGVIHCCLDPIDLEYDENTIITDSSYGGLYWTVEADLTKAKGS